MSKPVTVYLADLDKLDFWFPKGSEKKHNRKKQNIFCGHNFGSRCCTKE